MLSFVSCIARLSASDSQRAGGSGGSSEKPEWSTHEVACALKRYLRSLDEACIPDNLHQDFYNASIGTVHVNYTV